MIADRIRDITKLEEGEHVRLDLSCDSTLIIQRSGGGFYVGVFDPRNFVRVTDEKKFFTGWNVRQESFCNELEALEFINQDFWSHRSVCFYAASKALPTLRALFTAMSLAR
jgi:hypothetical protein